MCKTHPCTNSTPQCKCTAALYTSCPDINLKSHAQVRSLYLSFHWLIVKLNMAAEQRWQPKQLLTGNHVSGSFGEYYDNPNPDDCRQKRQKIYGTVFQACGERKYTVWFDYGMVMECFSNTLRLENWASSLPPFKLQAAAKEVEAQVEHADATAIQVVEENEVAVQDAAEEEHLPETSPEDDESVAFSTCCWRSWSTCWGRRRTCTASSGNCCRSTSGRCCNLCR